MAAYRVLYDEQCEICQAGASWLRAFVRRPEDAEPTVYQAGCWRPRGASD